MALVVANRVQETSNSSGTGALSLAGAVLGYQTFASGIGNANTTYYALYDSVAHVWEVGIGTVTVNTPSELSRDTILANSSGNTSPLTLAGNTINVWCDYPASKAVYKDANGDVTLGGALTVSGTATLAAGAVLNTPASGNLSNCTVDGTDAVGFRNIPQNAQTGSYTLVAADSGKHIYHASGAGAATYTIPANGSVAYAIGTAVTFVNLSATSISIAITTDTLYLAGAGTTGTRTLAQYGTATALKITSTAWVISGAGLS